MVKNYGTLINNLVFTLLLSIFLISPYFRGLFFRENAYLFQLIITLVCFIVVLNYWFNRNDNIKRPKQKIDVNFYKNVGLPNRVIDIILWCLPFAYLLSFFNAADTGLARDEFLRNIIYVFVYIILIVTIKTKIHQTIVFNIFIISALWISLYGYGLAMGSWEFVDGVLGLNRLASIFQYPNTLAALVGATFFASQIMALKFHSIPYQKLQATSKMQFVYSSIISSIYVMLAMIFLTTMLLTQSRAAMLVFVIVYIIGLAIIPLRDKLSYIAFSLITFVPALYVAHKVNDYFMLVNQQRINPNEITLLSNEWNTLLLTSITVFIMGFFYSIIHNCRNLNKKMFVATQIFTVIVLLISIMSVLSIGAEYLSDENNFANQITKRLTTFLTVEQDHSFNERVVFYNDASKIFKDYPIIGAGGGAWRVLFESYQSHSYWSTQAHGYFLQLATETGVIGLMSVLILILVVLFIAITFYYKRQSDNCEERNYLILATTLALIMLLGHSTVDFNMAYAYFATSVWLLFAIIISELQLGDNHFLENPNINSAIEVLRKPLIPERVQAVTLTTIVVCVFLANLLPVIADLHAREAQKYTEQSEFEMAKHYLELSYKYDSLDMHKGIELASLIGQTAHLYNGNQQEMHIQAIEIMQKLSNQRPLNMRISEQLVHSYNHAGYTKNAIQELDRAILLSPYNPLLYAERLYRGYLLAELYVLDNDIESARQHLSATVNVYYDYLKIKEKIIVYPSNRTFELNLHAELYVGKAMYLSGDFSTAITLFERAAGDANLREDSYRWLAASSYRLYDTDIYETWLNKAQEYRIENASVILQIIKMPIIHIK